MLNKTQEEIIKNWDKKYNKPLVSISCICFNQEKYIAQTIEGFLNQITSFPFEILIHDDASTDKTKEILQEYETKYSSIIKPIYEVENQWSKGRIGSLVFNIPRALGKYIALCEGDDYWIDNYKLQKQVDFLENNPDYGMCYTKSYLYNQNLKKFENLIIGSKERNTYELLKLGNNIPTLTTCINKELILKYAKEINPLENKWKMDDYPMWIWFSYNSKIKFLNFISACYRVIDNSASHSKDINKMLDFSESSQLIRDYFVNLYSIDGIKKYNRDETYFRLCMDKFNLKECRKVKYENLSIKYKLMYLSTFCLPIIGLIYIIKKIKHIKSF